jgi:flagellar biosynthesis chaperone FliJ
LAADVEAGKGAVAAQRIRVGEFQDLVAEARQHLAEAARDVEVLNKHRERLEKSFLSTLERKEAQEQDEMGSIIFNHGRRHESSQ